MGQGLYLFLESMEH